MSHLAIIYHFLVKQYKKDYKGHFVDEYEGQNRLNREATKYAIQNTIKVWRESLDARTKLPKEDN